MANETEINTTFTITATNSSRAAKFQQATVLPPTSSQAYSDFQYSLHASPKSLTRELASIFPGTDLSSSTVYIIPTFQKSCIPLLEFGDVQANEKDRLLERFFEWCTYVYNAIKQRDPNAWVDATDPASGLAWKGPSASCYSDVDGIVRVLHYDTFDVGGCRVLIHPQWKFAVYPATLFTNAHKDIVIDALNQVNQIKS